MLKLAAFGIYFQNGVNIGMNREIIGVSGTNGAGKDTFTQYWLRRTHGLQIGLGDMLRSRLAHDVEPSRANLANLSAELRRQRGLAVLVDIALEQYSARAYSHLVLNGIRHPSEAQCVKGVGGTMIWIDAPIETRYRRVRQSNRGRFEDDVTFEQFRKQELREMSADNEASVNLTSVKGLADVAIVNGYHRVEDFERHIDELFFRN